MHITLKTIRCFSLGMLLLVATLPAVAQSRIVISQVYGGGGNSGAPYKNDFIELFNSGDTAQNLTGWTVQYASSTAATWATTPLTGTIQPGHYFLVQESAGGGGAVALPAADISGAIDVSETTGKVALVRDSAALTQSCPTDAIVDFVGYGAANCYEGLAAAPGLTNTTALVRVGGGCTDGNWNSTDFTAGAPAPRNSSAATQTCIALGTFGPLATVSQNEGNSGTTPFNFIVKLNLPANAPVTFNATTHDGTATAPSDYTALSNVPFTIPVGQQTATVQVLVNGDTVAESNESFTVVLSAVSGALPTLPTLQLPGMILNDDNGALPLSFSPSLLPGGSVGVVYSQVLTVINGGACTFSTSGTVPPGLNLSSIGIINTATLSGTPTSSGTFGFTVAASCTNGSVSQAYSVNVASANLSFSPASLPAGSAGVAYSQVLTVTNGVTCKFTVSGTVPPGLNLGSSGTTNTATLSGTPTTSGTFGFTVSASCANGSVSQPYSVNVANASLSFNPTSLPAGSEGVMYSQVLTVTNGGACTFSTSGTVPPGLSLGSSGTTNTATLIGRPSFSGTSGFTVSANCSNGSASQAYSIAISFACESGVKTSTAIHTIQGSGAVSPMTGQTVEVEGIVVGGFQASTQLLGFYLQEPDATWDSDPATSEGIFIFDNLAGASVNVGDRVRVRGTVSELSSSGSFLGNPANSSLTEIGPVAAKAVCGSGNAFTRTTVTLPTTNAGDLERYEGMAVQFTQQLQVTGNSVLGTTGSLDLAPSVLYAPTSSKDQTTWPVTTNLNQRSLVALDDGSLLGNANLYPTLFPQGGLSATNTLRNGALVNYDSSAQTNSPLIGVLDDRFGEYRIQPTATVTFYNMNVRPAIAPLLTSVGGRFRAVSANVLNFFTTLGSGGAANQTEFNEQKTKLIDELSGMNADLYGLSEVQNFANGGANGGTYTNAALQSLVDGLNCKAAGLSPVCATPPTGPYALIDTIGLGANNGTDAIRSAIIYNPSVLKPVGGPATYYQNDTNRPTLAQTFMPATGAKTNLQTFTFVVNHFRSRIGACGGTSDDIYQGNCNGLRLSMSQNVTTWLGGNPTGDPLGAARRILQVGDFNAYCGENPIQYISTNGYTNLIAAIVHPGGYSYYLGSQAGYLDHTMANAPMNLLVKSVAQWHNNADEPSSLEALDSVDKSAAAQAAYYGDDPYAAADHDPIVIGFNPLAGDLNDDGVVDMRDLALLSASFNKPASSVDRRMDYDGDGVITVNDYRLWLALHRAFAGGDS